MNFTIYKLDGSIFATSEVWQKGFLWKKQASSAGRSRRKGLARMHFKFVKKDPAGEYKVKAKVADLNADISFEIELDFYLK